MLQACFRNIFLESCLNRTIFDRLRKTRDIFDEVLAWLDLEYFMDEEVYLLHLHGKKLLFGL